jgi:FKBP-type peptidyl-prolyl cis-trans isomerase
MKDSPTLRRKSILQKNPTLKVFLLSALVLVIILSGVLLVNKESLLKNINMDKNTIIKQDNGLVIEEIQIGTGDTINSGDTANFHYTGMLENGNVFDSSIDRGEPLPVKVGVGMVIKGWDEGLVGMKVGGKRKLIIPSELAYGSREIPGVIPANSNLIFEVEAVSK